MSGEISNSEHLESIDASGTANQGRGQPPAQVPHSAADANPPSPPSSNTKTHKPNRDRLDYVKFGVEVVGLGFLIAYTVYAGLQWGAMKGQLTELRQQTTLTRQQVVGTYAAVVRIVDFAGISLQETGHDTIDVAFRNDGRTISKEAHANFYAQRMKLPDGELIGEPFSQCFLTPSVITPDPRDTKLAPCPLVGLSKIDWEAMHALKQTIGIRGNLTYDNGFGDSVPTKICLDFVPKIRTKFGEDGEGNFISCDSFPGRLQYLQERASEH
jgi:hypothetical protein